LRRLAVTEDRIAALDDWRAQRDLFTPAEQAALAFADQMTKSGHAVDDATWSELARHFADGEIVEVAAAIGLFNYFNRFNEALHMEITR